MYEKVGNLDVFGISKIFKNKNWQRKPASFSKLYLCHKLKVESNPVTLYSKISLQIIIENYLWNFHVTILTSLKRAQVISQYVV